MRPRRPWLAGRVLLLALLWALASLALPACGKAIGDSCSDDTDCGEDQFCDRTAPSGYCTRGPCEVGSCGDPEEAECVEFAGGDTFCMAVCGGDDDCRDGYRCLTSAGGVRFCYVP